MGTSAVFAGTVTDIQELRPRDPAAKVGSQRVIFSVAKGYRNVTSSRIEIVVSPDEAGCGFTFRKGRRYLVYARSESGFLTTGLCTRTRELWSAAADIAHLTRPVRTADAGKVAGHLSFRGQSIPGELHPRAVADVAVIVRGAGFVREGRTNSEGTFEFRGIPPVSFTVSAVPPWPYAAATEIEIEDPDPRQCNTDLLLQVRYDGRISGVLMDGRGRPLSGVKVQARAAGEGDTREARTSASGHYEITGLSPGAYAVGVNLTVPPSLESPYLRWFAPGTADRARAALVELTPGERKAIAPIRMPAPLQEVTLAGCVVGPDQRPTTEVSVHVIWYQDSRSSSLIDYPDLDNQGCFSIRGLRGLRYEFDAYATSLRDARGYLFNTTQAITAGEQASPIRLVLAPHKDR